MECTNTEAGRPIAKTPRSRDKSLEKAASRVSVRPARSLADLEQVLKLRHANYGCFESASRALDDLDLASHCLILVAEVQGRGIVGTLRLLESSGPVELDSFIPVGHIPVLQRRSFVEASRLTIRRCGALAAVKLLLCKAHWLYTLRMGHELMLMSSTSTHASFYEEMLCVDLGHRGQYRHPVLRNAVHRTFCLSAVEALGQYRRSDHHYFDFMTRTGHDIRFE